MTSELERIKILESKISQVVDFINKLVSENARLKQQLKELKAEKMNFESQAKKIEELGGGLKKFEEERKILKEKIESIITQIDQVGI